MNRRSFIGSILALLAIPKPNAIPYKTRGPQLPPWNAEIVPRGTAFDGGAPTLVRASRDIQAHSLVVWDRVDSKGIPRIRTCRDTNDANAHCGRIGVTYGYVNQHNYTYISTKGGLVRPT